MADKRKTAVRTFFLTIRTLFIVLLLIIIISFTGLSKYLPQLSASSKMSEMEVVGRELLLKIKSEITTQ